MGVLSKVRSLLNRSAPVSDSQLNQLASDMATLQQAGLARAYADGFKAGVEETVNHLAGMGAPEGVYRGPMPPELAEWIINTAGRIAAVDVQAVADDAVRSHGGAAPADTSPRQG